MLIRMFDHFLGNRHISLTSVGKKMSIEICVVGSQRKTSQWDGSNEYQEQVF